MQDLRDLDARRPLKDPTIPAGVGVVNSTLVASEWKAVLAGHPDREFAAFVVRGIQDASGSITGGSQAEKLRRICSYPSRESNPTVQ